MYVVIIFSVIAVILSLIAGYTNWRRGMLMGFILLTVLSCIHYNYGNDYAAYFTCWKVISQTSLRECISGSQLIYPDGVRPDIGWIFLNKLFAYKNGFFILIACLSIFENAIYYKLIKNTVPRKWWWLAVFIYLFDFRYYVLNFSMLRQGLTVCLGILSVYYFGKKNYKISALILAIATTIHISALILIPVVIVSQIGSNCVRRYVRILLIVTIVLFLSPSIATRIFDSLINYAILAKYKELYAGWTATGRYGVGFILIIVQYILMLYSLYFFSEKDLLSGTEKTLILIAYSAILIKPFEAVGAALIERLGFYFSAFDIAVFPLIYSKLNKKLVKYTLVLLLIILTLHTYIEFWNKPVYHDYYAEFHTVFEAR